MNQIEVMLATTQKSAYHITARFAIHSNLPIGDYRCMSDSSQG